MLLMILPPHVTKRQKKTSRTNDPLLQPHQRPNALSNFPPSSTTPGRLIIPK